MKRIALLSLFFLACSCTAIVEDLASLHLSVENLKKQAEEYNASMLALEEIVNSITANFITEVSEMKDEDGNRTGYLLVYQDGQEIEMPFGSDGIDGRDGFKGMDGSSPTITVRKDNDGQWYWAIDSAWMTDASGNKIPVGCSGISPKVKIENNSWYYSIDNGKTWTYMSQATANSKSIFKSIDFETSNEYVIIKLLSGSELKIPRYIDFEVRFSDSVAALKTGQSVRLEYAIIQGPDNPVVSVLASEGLDATVVASTATEGYVQVTASSGFSGGKVTVFISKNYRSYMKTYSFAVGYEGLSANGTANCYMISEAGTYRFYALVRGNSLKQHTATPVRAFVLWESFGTLQAPYVNSIIRSVELKSDGYVEFSTPAVFREGNAVIAIADDSDNILWSWHIWAVDYNPAINHAVFQSHPNNPMMMMNLGALSSEEGNPLSSGLLYQWGRKDPFLGGASYENTSMRAASTMVWPDPVNVDEVTGNVAYATSHPATLLCMDSNNILGWNCWAVNDWEDASKSEYDPCPSGWRVPPYDNGSWQEIRGYWTRSSYGYVVPEPYSTPALFFPGSGYIYPQVPSLYLSGFGNTAYYWTSGYTGDSLGYDNGYIIPYAWGMGKTYALPVRCCSL